MGKLVIKSSSMVALLLIASILLLVTRSGMVLAYPTCGAHYLSKTCYPDEEEGLTSVFTTEDYWVVCGVYGPFIDCYELRFKWYDPHGNEAPPTTHYPKITVYYYYSGGILLCVEGYFYIYEEEREPGQYRVEFWETSWPGDVLLFTDYFQICAPGDFTISADPSSLTFTKPFFIETKTSDVEVTAISGFSGDVALSLSWVDAEPRGLKASISPAVVNPGGGTTTTLLTVRALFFAKKGTFTLRITGTSDTITHTVDVTIVIE